MIFENSLEYKDPELSAQWHPFHNGKLTPKHVTTGSNKKVWWKCNKGHEWHASVKSCSRGRGSGCPYCSGNKVLLGETDLAIVNPTLAREWPPTKDEGLKPIMVTANSGNKVWWKCTQGHEWQATVYARNGGHGCPYCSGRYPILGETDLATVNPTLAKEWHPIKNGNLQPNMISAASGKKSGGNVMKDMSGKQ